MADDHLGYGDFIEAHLLYVATNHCRHTAVARSTRFGLRWTKIAGLCLIRIVKHNRHAVWTSLCGIVMLMAPSFRFPHISDSHQFMFGALQDCSEFLRRFTILSQS